MNVGDKIREKRKELNLTQKKLGELSRTSESTIKQYEQGKRQPRLDQLTKIALALGVTVSDLVTDWNSFTHEEITNDLDGTSSALDPFATIAAHFEGEEFTEEQLEKIKAFAEFIKSQD